MAAIRVDDILPIVGLLGQLFAKSAKGKAFFEAISDVLTYHTLVENVRGPFDLAVKTNSGLTLSAEDVATLDGMFTNLDKIMDKVKAHM